MYHQQYNPFIPPPTHSFTPYSEYNYFQNPENVSIIDLMRNDQTWVNLWLSDKNKSCPSQEIYINNKTTITVVKNDLLKIHTLIKQIKELENDLRKNVKTYSSEEWNLKTQLISEFKDQLRKYFSKFDSTDALCRIQKCINKRKKKRLVQKMKKKALQQGKEVAKKACAEKHIKIDALMQEMKKAVEHERQMEIRARDTEAFLYSVKTRISEARHWINVIDNLKLLRSARSTAALGRGESVDTEHTRTFNKIMNDLTSMWTSTLEKYMNEEIAMTSQSSLKNSESCVEDSETLALTEWERALWGAVDESKSKSTTGDAELNEFIAIRRKWDFFIVPDINQLGSKIPIGWILPEKPSSSDWEKYLANK